MVGSGSRPPATSEPEVVHETVVVEHEPVEVSCGGSPDPEPVDDYDYYDRDESCYYDTTSDYDSTDDPDCSSDTSSSSDTSEADCSSDTGSTTYTDHSASP